MLLYKFEYKKTYPAILLAIIWFTLLFLFAFCDFYFSNDTGVFYFAGFMSMFAIVCILLHIFRDSSIDYICVNDNKIYINYRIGKNKYKLCLPENDIKKIIFKFKIKAHSKAKAGFYNYICMDIDIEFNDNRKLLLQDEYIMNGIVLHVGKNKKQLSSVKYLVNMFSNFEKFSYEIQNIHAIYDKDYEPNNIKSYINS
jgi:hypothetical protein